MVKLTKGLILVFSIVIFISSPVMAEQGFYGVVYTNTSDSGGTYIADSVVSGAVVWADAMFGSFLEDTVASACGYYVISVDSPGWYYLHVDSGYYDTRLMPCGNISSTNELRGPTDDDAEYVGSGSWTRKDIHVHW